MDTQKIMQTAEKLEQKIVEVRRKLHQNAETGFDTQKTLKIVESELNDIGIEFERCGKAGIVALIGKNEGKTFMLRADMDALPIKEETDLDFACENGNMHACGHDMHTAMLLGAAHILKENENEINGRVKLMFQSAEEILSGSKDMIDSGVLENPKVDAAMMLHIMPLTSLEAGSIIVSKEGAAAPSAEYFEIEIQGKGAHGAMPEKSRDPLSASAHTLINLQNITSMEIAAGDVAVLTVTKLNSGDALNVIPDSVTLGGSFRAFDEEIHAYIKSRIEEIADLTAKTFKTQAQTRFSSYAPALKNDGVLSKAAEKYTVELLREKTFSQEKMEKENTSPKASGSEDFAFVSQEVPSIMLAISAGLEGDGVKYPLHHPKVFFDESCLKFGAAVESYCAMRWLEENRSK